MERPLRWAVAEELLIVFLSGAPPLSPPFPLPPPSFRPIRLCFYLFLVLLLRFFTVLLLIFL